MGYIGNGSNWDYQNVDLINTYTASGTIASSGVSYSYNVVNGLNIGSPSISGTQPGSGIVTFLVPVDYSSQTLTFAVANDGVAGCSVLVSGATTGVTLNGGTAAVSIVKGVGKTFYATSGNTWVSY